MNSKYKYIWLNAIVAYFKFFKLYHDVLFKGPPAPPLLSIEDEEMKQKFTEADSIFQIGENIR